MEKERDLILVPWEFKESNEVSLQHAVQLAKAANNEILFAHVAAPKKMFESRKKKDAYNEEITKKMKGLSEKFTDETGIKSHFVVREGKLEKTLNSILEETRTNLIVTHSDNAISRKKPNIVSLVKTTKNNSVPFILTQKVPTHSRYIEVVIPIDYDRRFKETVRWVMHMAKYYKCNLNFIKPYFEDEDKKRLMSNNMYFTKKMLDANEIVYGIKTAKKNRSYSDEILLFANKIDADLIVLMSGSYKRYVLSQGKEDQFTFEEKTKIPIMCINPLVRKYQGFN